MLMFAGQMGCEALNWVLKRLIKEERPRRMYGKGYGMPSSHAQFVTFFAVFLSLFLLVRHQPHPTRTHTPISFPTRFLLSIAAMGSAAAVAASRIYLNYHTPRQVLVGCAAGAASAVVWFAFTSYLRSAGWTDWLLEQDIAKWCRLRDLVIEEDLVDAGWARWLDRRSDVRKTTPDSSKKKR